MEARVPAKVLVPVDFSVASAAAVDWALMLGRTTGAQVELLHVWRRPGFVAADAMLTPPVGAEVSVSDYVRRRAGEQMAGLIETLRLRGFRDVRGRIEPGDPARAIVAVARQGAFDLIVMGTHGRTGLSHLFEGSVAEKVVRLAGCPVVTVRFPAEAAQVSLVPEEERP